MKNIVLFLLLLVLVSCGVTSSENESSDFTGPGARDKYTFDEISALLNSPELVSEFTKNNIKWDGAYDNNNNNEFATAELIYQRGIDDCDGHAIFQCTMLEKHGYDAFMIGLSIEGPVGHAVCGVRINGEILILDNKGKQEGPFPSLADVAKFYIAKEWMMDRGSLKTILISQIEGIPSNITTPNVMELPWDDHSY